jgi:hypothetical protein
VEKYFYSEKALPFVSMFLNGFFFLENLAIFVRWVVKVNDEDETKNEGKMSDEQG